LVGSHRHVLIYRHYKLHLHSDIVWLDTNKISSGFKKIYPANWSGWVHRHAVS